MRMYLERLITPSRQITQLLAVYARTWWYIGFPLIVGIGLRFVVVFYNPHVIFADEPFYHDLAQRISRGESYGMPFWPPGWPIILGLAYFIFGSAPAVGHWLNFAASLATIALVASLVHRLYGRRASIWSIWIVALAPSYILLNALLMYEVWLQFLMVLALWCALRPTWNTMIAVLIAVITALVTLIRPTWIMLPMLLWVCNKWYQKYAIDYKIAGFSQLLAIALIVPWLAYSSALAGRFVPIALNGGMNLWIGNNPHATGAYIDPPAEFWFAESDATARDLALQYIADHPLQVLKLWPVKVWYMMRVEGYANIYSPLFVSNRIEIPEVKLQYVVNIMNVFYWTLLAAAIWSISILTVRRQFRQLLPLTLFFYNIATYLPFFGLSRYRWPLQFILIIYAAALPVLLRQQSDTLRELT